MKRGYLSTGQVAAIFGVHRITVIHWANRGDLPALRCQCDRESRMYRAADVERYKRRRALAQKVA